MWEFIEGEDFTGSAANFRARAKTAARRQGVDFNSVQRQRGDKAVLKILAFMMPVERPTEAAIAPAVAPMTQLTLPI